MAGLQSAEEVYKQLATETTRAKAAGTQFRAELAPRLRLLYQVANTLEITYGPLLSAMMPQTAGALWAKLGNSLVSEALSLIGADLDALIDFQKVWKLKQIMEAQLATEPGFSAYFNGRRLAMAQASGTATQIATWTKSTVAGCSTGG
jgi:hypothetical protein